MTCPRQWLASSRIRLRIKVPKRGWRRHHLPWLLSAHLSGLDLLSWVPSWGALSCHSPSIPLPPPTAATALDPISPSKCTWLFSLYCIFVIVAMLHKQLIYKTLVNFHSPLPPPNCKSNRCAQKKIWAKKEKEAHNHMTTLKCCCKINTSKIESITEQLFFFLKYEISQISNTVLMFNHSINIYWTSTICQALLWV